MVGNEWFLLFLATEGRSNRPHAPLFVCWYIDGSRRMCPNTALRIRAGENPATRSCNSAGMKGAKMTKVCNKCGKEFPSRIVIDGIERDIKRRKYCLDCSPFGEQPAAKTRLSSKDHGVCKNCGKPLTKSGKIFCNCKCHRDYQYKEYIADWKEHKNDGTIGKSWIAVSHKIRRYLYEKYDGKCARCGWSEVNPYTNTIPLEIEHIDGDAENNTEENLILLCPNCHSLTRTYRGANRGNGTRNIKWVSRGGTTNV